jgi:hypothetical protein
MITNFKIFESLNRQLKIGDYVVTGKDMYATYQNFTIKAFDIGQLYNITPPYYWFNFNGNKISLKPEEILYWSENKEELETIIAANKYNI